MTYCVGILVREGLVMIADTRTNAGLDNIATFRKLHLFMHEGERVIGLASAGNLAVSQSVLTLVSEGLRNPDNGESESLLNVPSMFRAAQLVGRAIREVHRVDGESLEQQSGSFDVSMLLGGQIGTERPRLFMIYAAGNFIEATADTPYLQIGEHKYGKPILDRSITEKTELYDALKLGLISMDSTIRSNLSVGMPLDLAIVRRDGLAIALHRNITAEDAYFKVIRDGWGESLRNAFHALPDPSIP